MKPEALGLGAAGCQKEDLAPFQALAPATLLTAVSPSPAPAQLLAGSWPGFWWGCSRVVGAGPCAFGGRKLLGQSAVTLETLAFVYFWLLGLVM